MKLKKISGTAILNGNVIDGLEDNSTTNAPSQRAVNEALKKAILFNDASNTATTITLNDSVVNYEYIEIFYKNNDSLHSSLKVHQANGKKISLDSHYPDGSSAYLKFARATISGTTITINSQTQVNISGSSLSTSTGNYTYITRVVGYN